jgi:hypothetical protein
MDIITERISKWQFTEKLHLDKKLIEELEQHLGNPNLRFIISWYDGYDLNNVHSYKRYILIEDKDHIKDEIEFVLNKILSTDIMIFVGYCYVNSKELKFKKNVLLHYILPTDGYRFDKDLRKWIHNE